MPEIGKDIKPNVTDEEYANAQKVKAMLETEGWKVFNAQLKVWRDRSLISVGQKYGEECQRFIGSLTAYDIIDNYLGYMKDMKPPEAAKTNEAGQPEPPLIGPDLDKEKKE